MNPKISQMMLSPLHQSAIKTPKLAAVSVKGQIINYQTLSQRIVALGQQLKTKGLNSGDRLGIISQNNLEMLMLYWACIDLGILYCPISPKFPQSQINQLVTKYGIDCCWVAPELTLSALDCESLELDFYAQNDNSPTQISTENLSNIIFTSGSTGAPKAAVHQLKQHIASAEGSAMLIPIHAGDNWLLSLPLFHIGGLAILNRCALAGACVVFSAGQQSLPTQLKRDKVTHLSLVATQLQRLLKENAQSLTYLKALLLGGGAVSQPLLDSLARLKVKAFTSYGMTEMASQITTGIARADGSSGSLLPKRELVIRDGIIWVKGETLFAGYLTAQGMESSLDKDGWFCTKDCGFWDEHSNLHITGRSDNMFICGGENLQPEEVEAVLKQIPSVDDALVFPQQDDEFGVLPAAIIKGTMPNQADADRFICKQIARFKRPRYYYPWPEQVEQTGLKINRKKVIAAVTNVG